MALFEIDQTQYQQLDARLSELTQAINSLSDNVGKWQAQQTAVVQSGLTGLIAAVTGADVTEIQARINELTLNLKPEADALVEAAQTDNPTNEGER